VHGEGLPDANDLANERPEHPIPEVPRVLKSTRLIGKHQRILAEDVRPFGSEHLDDVVGEFDWPSPAGLGAAQALPRGEAAADPNRPLVQIDVDPSKCESLAEPGASVGKEHDQGMVIGLAVLHELEEDAELTSREHIALRDLVCARTATAPDRWTQLGPSPDGVFSEEIAGAGVVENRPQNSQRLLNGSRREAALC
jgi:hypothetical protein